ncbi:MAG: flagellar basal body P-ring protein FlgI, partial [Planctomycetota bacterium]
MSDAGRTRYRRPGRPTAIACAALTAAVIGGCTSLGLSDANWPDLSAIAPPAVPLPWTAAKPTGDSFDGPGKELDVPLVGEYTTIGGLNGKPLQGVGLVVNLDGTGEDPPPSGFRTALIDEMKKREVPNPNEVLASPNTALVVVNALLPPLAKKGDTFDVEVRLPPNSEAKSLAGGRLLGTYLYEAAILGDATRKGHEFGLAKGPILLSTDENDDRGSSTGVLRRGRVVGGGRSTKHDRVLSLFIRDEFKSIRKSRQIADAVGKRFHAFDERGLKQPLAEAKTDRRVELDLHPAYREDHARYLRVVRAVAFRETEVARRIRMRRLEERLQESRSSRLAALELEAAGAIAVPILRRALENDSAEVRFR